MPPKYMTPGTPRFRLPDFWVRISPRAPNRITVPKTTAAWNSAIYWLISRPSFLRWKTSL